MRQPSEMPHRRNNNSDSDDDDGDDDNGGDDVASRQQTQHITGPSPPLTKTYWNLLGGDALG
jgi:hypothetical protein